ncbi:pyrroloquinoline quinone biosynthesis protein PqqE [Spirillospora sp. CA-294931]|uniref:pyrroloquinoline quinone biosynthesis protein PqqE n=1 Tax=Spirillospora sp. CA-294931 TaxID=3240042 RepID=UPI003D901CB8
MTEAGLPWALLAELTHDCPLHCPYCSNPLELIGRTDELTAEEWGRVMREAAGLGVLSTHLSGGEPLRRRDLAEIVAATRDAGIYSQLVTSGLGLGPERLAELVAAGLDCVQLSVQHASPAESDLIAGTRAFEAKGRAAGLVRESGLALGLNVVLHRRNLDAVDAIIELGVSWGVQRIELANAQYQGWALRNLRALLPDREQLARAEESVARWRERLDGRIEIIWVLPDYFTGVPKPCMGGWGAVSLTVAPDGTVLPCPGAYVMEHLTFPNVRDASLADIWHGSPAFDAYRGTGWMNDTCASCSRRDLDFGGCRCQAYALTGDAARTDPACSLSPDHHLVKNAGAGSDSFVYRASVRGARGAGKTGGAGKPGGARR